MTIPSYREQQLQDLVVRLWQTYRLEALEALNNDEARGQGLLRKLLWQRVREVLSDPDALLVESNARLAADADRHELADRVAAVEHRLVQVTAELGSVCDDVEALTGRM